MLKIITRARYLHAFNSDETKYFKCKQKPINNMKSANELGTWTTLKLRKYNVISRYVIINVITILVCHLFIIIELMKHFTGKKLEYFTLLISQWLLEHSY